MSGRLRIRNGVKVFPKAPWRPFLLLIQVCPRQVWYIFRRLIVVAGRVDVEPLGSDALFIADLEVGNPPQLLKIAVDTGSCDL